MQKIELYRPDKYKVFLGEGNNVALCTCWSDPEMLIKQNKELLRQYALIGTLYSKEGVSIMLRNLALNPHITSIAILADSPLSKTPIGSAARELMEEIWRSHKFEGVQKEIDRDALAHIVKNVKLIAPEKIDGAKKSKPYMKPQSFPEPQRSATAQMPSEEVGWAVNGRTTYETWLKVIDRILRYGAEKKTEYGNSQKELQSITWTIMNEDIKNFYEPDVPKELKDHIGISKHMREEYKNILFSKEKPATTAYTYGSRLHDFPGHIDQIGYIIEKIKEATITRRAFATTYHPETDTQHSSPPCLTNVQILADTKGRLNFFASFRSHDMFKAAISNAYGLLCLQKHIATETKMHMGMLSIQSISAHIYEEDWDNALNTVKCQMWESVKPYFDEKTDIDPRGLVRIQKNEKELLLELVDENGEVLYVDRGMSARIIATKLAKLDLLSKPAHYVDITLELTKAEIALKDNLAYVQDRPLIFEMFALK
jgi:thymidylate synthase